MLTSKVNGPQANQPGAGLVSGNWAVSHTIHPDVTQAITYDGNNITINGQVIVADRNLNDLMDQLYTGMIPTPSEEELNNPALKAAYDEFKQIEQELIDKRLLEAYNKFYTIKALVKK